MTRRLLTHLRHVAEGSPEQYVVRLREAEEKRLDLVAFGAAAPAGMACWAWR